MESIFFISPTDSSLHTAIHLGTIFFDVNSIAEAMKKIAIDKELRNELSFKSIRQGKKFTWDKSAEGLWQSFQKMMEHLEEEPKWTDGEYPISEII